MGQFVVRIGLGDEKKFGNMFVPVLKGESPRGPELSSLNAILEDASTLLPEVLHETDTGIEVCINIQRRQRLLRCFGFVKEDYILTLKCSPSIGCFNRFKRSINTVWHV